MKTKLPALFFIGLSLAGLSYGNIYELLEPVEEAPKAQHKVLLLESESSGSFKKDHPQTNTEDNSTPHRLITKNEAAEVIRNALVEKFNPKGDLHVYVDYSFPKIELEDECGYVEVTRFPSNGIQKNFIIGIKAYAKGKEVGQWNIPVSCELWKDALVSTRKIERGEKLFSDYFEVQSIDSLSLSQGLVSPCEKNLINVETRKAIPLGAPLLFSDIREQPNIRRGQIVDVVARDGLLSISMKAEALEDGFKKEFVTVRNLESKKKFQAQIIDEGIVQIYL